MSPRPRYALLVLLAALVACEKAGDSDELGQGDGGELAGGSTAKDGAGGAGGAGAAAAGIGAGRSAEGGAVSARGGTGASGGAAAGNAARPDAGGRSGAGESSGPVAGGGQAGSAIVGGNGGNGGWSGNVTGSGGRQGNGGNGGTAGAEASAGSSALAGAGGEPDEPSSTCVDPLQTVDVSRLVASEAFESYVVTGNTANQIRQSINQNRDTEYDANTSWYVSWQFADCAGNGLVVTVDVTYDFPEWKPSATAAPELVASWQTYQDALFCHEYGHAEHGLDCANDVYTALAAIDAGGDCGKQQAEADATFSAILAEYNQLDLQYDADTQHGATMGAIFPPPQTP